MANYPKLEWSFGARPIGLGWLVPVQMPVFSYNNFLHLVLIAIAYGLLRLSLEAQWINRPTPGIPRDSQR